MKVRVSDPCITGFRRSVGYNSHSKHQFIGILNFGNGLTITGWSLFNDYVSIPESPLVYDQFQKNCNNHDLLSKASHGIILCYQDRNIFGQVSSIAKSNLSGAIFVFDQPISIMEDCPCVAIRISNARDVVKYISDART